MSSPIDEATVRHVADLAMLRLPEKELRRMAEQLASILDYVRQLEEVDTTNVPPTGHPTAVNNVFRDDTVTPGLAPEQALRNAPQHQDGFFRVPKVLDRQST